MDVSKSLLLMCSLLIYGILLLRLLNMTPFISYRVAFVSFQNFDHRAMWLMEAKNEALNRM